MSKAIVARRTGGPEVLKWVELDPGQPGPGEVLLRQTAIGVNFVDIYNREGLYPWAGDFLVPGGEAAGVIAAIGPDVAGFAIGERVAYTMGQGSYREHRVVPAHRLVKLPDFIADDVAASIMLKGLTTHYLLRQTFPVKAGDLVLFHAAAGGVGLIAGQWLKALGAVSVGTAGTAAKVELALAHGYTHAINYRTGDFVTEALEASGGRKFDAVFDSVGKDTWQGSLKLLKPRGLFVSFGQASGPVTDFSLLDLSRNGSLFATRPTLFDYIADPADLQQSAAELFARIGDGTIHIDHLRHLPLKDAAEAHRSLAARETVGATVLLP